jgi:hypothetical protein
VRQKFRVETRTGEAGPAQPTWVVWEGVRRKVEAIEGTWQEPDRVLVRVALSGGLRLLLSYRLSDGTWAGIPAGPPASRLPGGGLGA